MADDLEPGMWRLTDATGTRMGRYTEDWWEVADRAGAKFSPTVPPDEPLRYDRALEMAKAGARR